MSADTVTIEGLDGREVLIAGTAEVHDGSILPSYGKRGPSAQGQTVMPTLYGWV